MGPISSTLKRQREIWCAYVIQRSFRRYRELRGPLGEGGPESDGGDDDNNDDDEDEDKDRQSDKSRDDDDDETRSHDDDDDDEDDGDNTSGDVSKEAVDDDEETVDSEQPSHGPADATSPNSKEALGDTSTGDASSPELGRQQRRRQQQPNRSSTTPKSTNRHRSVSRSPSNNSRTIDV